MAEPKGRIRKAVDAVTPRQPGQPPKGPTTEQGVPAPYYSFGASPIMPWSQYIDQREHSPDLQWRGGDAGSTRIYHEMELGDAQVKGLLMASTLPVRRLWWGVDPNGATDQVTEHIADDFNLPIEGSDPSGPTRVGAFNHDRHLAHSLLALAYGHQYFERVYEYADPRKGGDGLMHLAKLGTRPPWTIMNFFPGKHGELLGILQRTGVDMSNPGRSGPFGVLGGQEIDANSLLAFVWDSADDGDHIGRSMLRPLYRNWLLKDRLLRVDANKHERNGMGIPWFETDKSATKDQIESLAEIAQEMRVGTRGGGAGPGRLRIAAPEGHIPETIQSVRYHDEQMAAAFLAMFIQLGKGETGSYSLGQSLIDFHAQSIEAIADWYAQCMQAQIEDAVLTNFGEGVQQPKLCWQRVESLDLALADLATAVDKGLIVVDEEFREYVGQRWKIPGQRPEQVEAHEDKEAANAPPPPPATPPMPMPPSAPPETPPAASRPGPKPDKRSALADSLLTRLSDSNGPLAWPDLARAAGTNPKNGTARRARDMLIAEGAMFKRASDGKLAPLGGLQLPDRELKRNPQAFEVEAKVDFQTMEAVYTDAVDQLVQAVSAAQGAQIAELTAEVEAAGGDPAKLAALSAEPVPLEVIEPILQDVASEGVDSARRERDGQIGGANAVAAAEPSTAELEATVKKRAEAAALTLAGGLSAAASKKAAAVSTLAPDAAAETVGAYLGELSDAALKEQLGGATQQAYNSGRRSFMSANKPATVYASEILDQQTCANCNAIDGEEWPNVSEAETAYPVGGYVECEGGLRCRGTLVSVY